MPTFTFEIQIAGHFILDGVEAVDRPHAVRILNEMGVRDDEWELCTTEAEAMVREDNELTHG